MTSPVVCIVREDSARVARYIFCNYPDQNCMWHQLTKGTHGVYDCINYMMTSTPAAFLEKIVQGLHEL
jgi:hypothetical protein